MSNLADELELEVRAFEMEYPTTTFTRLMWRAMKQLRKQEAALTRIVGFSDSAHCGGVWIGALAKDIATMALDEEK